ncbi:hypothetical protein SAMN02745172_00799 [Pseudoxanthobacter soli DSM 19599]|uniref:Uncharacterized protein n=1 Tax=Pseudoxanthobacter soli DSM 19599 TaxID=1123029 RepID=A0A1M7Z9P3_9HYPH|nr:hypothetical protein [Pseudoxanthobacter soli]SHO61522.1 hypothetical protein SAMN02745172_00799 [Pseudoxanthobacter soli DSM 19599]
MKHDHDKPRRAEHQMSQSPASQSDLANKYKPIGIPVLNAVDTVKTKPAAKRADGHSAIIGRFESDSHH